MPENTGKIQEDTRFKKGQSGNPKGKPKGAKNKSTLAAESLLASSLETVCRRIEEEAVNGNMQAAKMILERFLPPRKDRLIKINLPEIKTYRDILSASNSIILAVGQGIISPSEGEALSRAITSHAQILEANELEQRLEALESRTLNS
jgi:Family of unknown function (DUF5681)